NGTQRIANTGFVVNYQYGILHLFCIAGRWQFDDKPRASRVVCHLDPAMVLRHNAINDGKTESCAAALGREIRLEKLLEISRVDAFAVIGELDNDHVPGRVEARFDDDSF